MVPAIALLCSLSVTPRDLPQWEARLGSVSFKEREQASRDLLKQNNLRLCRNLLKSHDPEVVRRTRVVHTILRTQALDNLGPYPCLDALLYHAPTRRYTWWDDGSQYAFLKKYGIDPYNTWSDDGWWTPYRQASRRWASDLIDYGVPPVVIKAIFQEMHRRDRVAGYALKEK